MDEDPTGSLACDLPGNLMLEILPRLPIKSLLKFKCVSQSWNSLNKNRIFIKMHRDHWSKVKDYSKIVVGLDHIQTKVEIEHRGSKKWQPIGKSDRPGVVMEWEPIGISKPDCYGLVGSSGRMICLSPLDRLRCGREFLVMNPAFTQSRLTYRKLTFDTSLLATRNFEFLSLGFGYDDKHKDYKIVRIERLKDNFGNSYHEIDIYSFSSDCWRKLENSVSFRLSNCIATEAGNSLYWISKVGSYGDNRVTYFSLSNEKFQNFDLPIGRGSYCENIISYSWGCSSHLIYDPVLNNYTVWLACLREDTVNHTLDLHFWRKDDKIYSPEDVAAVKARHRKRVVSLRSLVPAFTKLTCGWFWRYKVSECFGFIPFVIYEILM